MSNLPKWLKNLRCAFQGHHWTKSRTRGGYMKCVRCGKRVPTAEAI